MKKKMKRLRKLQNGKAILIDSSLLNDNPQSKISMDPKSFDLSPSSYHDY